MSWFFSKLTKSMRKPRKIGWLMVTIFNKLLNENIIIFQIKATKTTLSCGIRWSKSTTLAAKSKMPKNLHWQKMAKDYHSNCKNNQATSSWGKILLVLSWQNAKMIKISNQLHVKMIAEVQSLTLHIPCIFDREHDTCHGTLSLC